MNQRLYQVLPRVHGASRDHLYSTFVVRLAIKDVTPRVSTDHDQCFGLVETTSEESSQRSILRPGARRKALLPLIESHFTTHGIYCL